MQADRHLHMILSPVSSSLFKVGQLNWFHQMLIVSGFMEFYQIQ